MQLNLCLSGFAGCYDPATYPANVEEAVARIAELRPDAVTVTEACRRDAATMADSLGYDVAFARVRYAGAPLPCVDPGDRGLFGNAVLTRTRIVGSESERFDAQVDLEERRWLCATTRSDVVVCAAHLETPHTPAAAAARNAQCQELAAVLATRSTGTFVFGGDVNRREACAPPGAWRRADSAADSAPGVQHVYGSADLRHPRSAVLPAELTDHDILVVHATLTRR
jgi:endonuclease/exonuclease/phosphatase family metal-dependent hydrolase